MKQLAMKNHETRNKFPDTIVVALDNNVFSSKYNICPTFERKIPFLFE